VAPNMNLPDFERALNICILYSNRQGLSFLDRSCDKWHIKCSLSICHFSISL